MNRRSKRTNPESELYRALLTLRTPEECFAFLTDLCTANELKAMEQRYEVARLLENGRIYSDILTETGASSATISRVNRSLNDYGTGAYRTVFARLEEQSGKTEGGE